MEYGMTLNTVQRELVAAAEWNWDNSQHSNQLI